MVSIGNSWDTILADDFDSENYRSLREFLRGEYAHNTVYPDMYDIFNALRFTPYENVKVVILGQDPYHGAGQAHGLCFSVKRGVQYPPSLQNIFKETASDVGAKSESGCLECWAKQGVLLLNTVLTVRAGQPLSHRGKGWEQLTDSIIHKLDLSDSPIVFLLWGGNARSKKSLLKNPNHLVLETVHPSPLSAYNGFFGCKHFSKANEFLTAHGLSAVDWNVY